MRAMALAVVLLAATACDGEPDEATKPCALEPAEPAATLPAGLPAGVDGATFFGSQQAGATTRYFAHLPGDDVVRVRDDIARAYENAGITIEGRDAEPPAEAELQWSVGDREGSVQVTPLCKGYLQVRYRVGPR